jgi:2-oxoglutarate ferredoxin oxidoreductase subunit alpha
VPLHETTMKVTGGKLSKNIVALAAVVRATHVPAETARDLIARKFKRKGREIVDKNLQAFDAGLELLGGTHDLERMHLTEASGEKPAGRVVLSGNQAISLGALAAGCNFVAGYPITPATQVLEFMMKYLPGMGGRVIQAEDEISAIASCLGASYSGAKAMTATSGPGLALMSELIGMASISEIPIVIVDVMRSGPGTGMPTKTEQSDLLYAIHGTPGEAPRIVIAATSIEDCFYQAINAFALAERYQMPVLLLSDQSMAYRTKTVEIPDVSAIAPVYRDQPSADALDSYMRYADTETGISPMAVPGTENGMFVASGLEHDEYGAANYTPENRERMVAKRFRKLETLERELYRNGGCYEDSADGAEVGVISWGSTEGPIREAIRRAQEDGVRIAHLQPKVLHPLPVGRLQDFIKPLKKVVVFEENHTSQFMQHLRANIDFNGTSLAAVNQCSGLPFTPDDVYDGLQQHL